MVHKVPKLHLYIMWPQIIDSINLEAKIFFPVYDPKGWVEW